MQWQDFAWNHVSWYWTWDVLLLTEDGPDKQELIEALDKLNESNYE